MLSQRPLAHVGFGDNCRTPGPTRRDGLGGPGVRVTTVVDMPRYDYRCRACGDTFEVTRSMSAVDAVDCPQGHDDTVKLLSTVALTGRGGSSVATPQTMGGGGGCCGGSCGCG